LSFPVEGLICNVFARCGKVLVVVALVLTTGLHWAALQTVAWTAMLAANLRCECVSQAVCATFDGKHPCCLCKAIAAAKKSEKKSDSIALTLKMEFPPVAESIILIPPVPIKAQCRPALFAAAFSPEPPVPPPRNLAA